MTEAAAPIRITSAVSPGTCGELAQGMLDGVTFLVTCPIDFYATAKVTPREGDGSVAGPVASPKAARAVELTLAHLGVSNADVDLQLESPLPRGKGMASSTADVAAAIVATADALGAQLAPREIADIALMVEPSDGVMFPGIALFDHRQGKVLELLGQPPAIRVVVLDFGGRVDTVTFNRAEMSSALSQTEPLVARAVDLIRQGISESDARLIGAGSTISARANQTILYKPYLESVIALASQVGAAGVNVAHSGTVVGMLFEDDVERVDAAVDRAWQGLSGLQSVYCHKVIGGGVKTVPAREVITI